MKGLTAKAEKELEERFALQREAIELLALVVDEWRSDPMSAQCFDLRIVRRAQAVVARLKELQPL
jgi:uncharacterized coiled-coil protein SlyX